MTEPKPAVATLRSSPAYRRRLARRHRAERRFRRFGMLAIAVAVGLLAMLLGNILVSGINAFRSTDIELAIYLDPDAIGQEDFRAVIRRALQQRFPEAATRRDVRDLLGLVSRGAVRALAAKVIAEPRLIGQTSRLWLPASDDVQVWATASADTAAVAGRLSDKQRAWLTALTGDGAIRTQFSTRFITSGDSREPELAGILGAMTGSFFTLLVTLAVTLPLGAGAAIYLEELAPRDRWTDLIEVNINNLAAVPSVIFGLLGLAVLLNVMHLPRSTPVVGGLTLALMTLPTIIIAARAAINAVPDSIREAAIGIGASPLQTCFHHVLPLALPGILTGTILGMARALGETAPLLLIGMVAFIADVPHDFLEAATVLPVQIFLWADSAERLFVEKTAGAILVLIAFLIIMNGTAIWLRNKYEQRW